MGSVTDSYELGNKPSCSVKGGEFLDQLSDHHQTGKEHYAPCGKLQNHG